MQISNCRYSVKRKLSVKTSTNYWANNFIETKLVCGKWKEEMQNRKKWIKRKAKAIVTWISCLLAFFAHHWSQKVFCKTMWTGKPAEYRARSLKGKKRLEYASEQNDLLDLRLVWTPTIHCPPANYKSLHITTLQCNLSPTYVSRITYAFAKANLPKLLLSLVNFSFFLDLPIDVFNSALFIKILFWIHAKVSSLWP